MKIARGKGIGPSDAFSNLCFPMIESSLQARCARIFSPPETPINTAPPAAAHTTAQTQRNAPASSKAESRNGELS
jgi:hypothetical protein